MSKKELDISRRKLLAGLGTAGVAAAGAGLGTTAYFNDTESFDGNSLEAGTLDLLLDYQVKYQGGVGRLEEIQDIMDYEDAEVIDEEEGTYLLEEVPTNGDQPEGWGEYVSEEEFCTDHYRDVLVNGDEVAPIRLSDVKPGDSGCLTTSLHLCGNPGYLWMQGNLIANDDNGLTEPEEEVDPDGGEGEGELAQNIETTVWYDENCDCALDEEGEDGGEVDVVLVLDRSGSMSGSMSGMTDAAEDLVGELGSNVNVGLVSYSTSASLDQEITSTHGDVTSALSGLTANGQTNIADGVDTAQNELTNGTNARSGARKIMVVMSDGEHNQSGDPVTSASNAKSAGTEVFTVAFGSADESTLQSMASDPVNAHFFPAADEQELIDAFSEIGQTIAGERVIFEGTLQELTDVLETGPGVPLDGDRETDYDEVDEGEPVAGTGDGRMCFEPGETHCIGLDWELPAEVENVIQSDSVAFNVGFYGEQCRNNDGSGPSQEA